MTKNLPHASRGALEQPVVGLTHRALAWTKVVQAIAQANRALLLALAMILFVGGVAWSASRLNLSFSDVQPFYILLSAVVFVPIAFVAGALSFMVMAHGVGTSVSFATAFRIACIAQFAEFLPVPGGAIVRGSALVNRGSKPVEAGTHVIVNAILWIACGALAAGLVLDLAHPVALLMVLGGSAGIVLCTLWLWRKAGLVIALAALALRIAGLGVAGARSLAAFLAIGATIGFVEVYPFAFATILGSAAAIVPGGMGISEMVAAAIALLSTVPPEAAFIAVGLNRLIGFVVSGIATGVISIAFGQKGPRD